MKKKYLKDPYDYSHLRPTRFDDRRELVIAMFLRGDPPENAKKFVDLVGPNNGGWGGGRGGARSMWSREGTPRVGYRDDGCLYSYDMPLALRTTYDGKPFIIINGDGSPTMQTSKHQRELRSVLQDGFVVDPGADHWAKGKELDDEGRPGRGWKTVRPKMIDSSTKLPHAFIPFSILDRPSIRLRDIRVISVTADFEIKKTVPDREKGGTKVITLHFLGETLFRDASTNRIYVCGLDRNDDPSSRMFYLAQLPRGAEPKTVDEALAALRPEGLPKSTKRQGEWFLVPEPRYKAAKAEIIKKVPIISDKPAEQADEREQERRADRHVATHMHLNGAVRVRGRLLDDEHDTLKLGDVWHRVVKNLAPQGWRYDKAAGARVD